MQVSAPPPHPRDHAQRRRAFSVSVTQKKKELTRTSTSKRCCIRFHTHRTDHELGHLCGTDHHGTNTLPITECPSHRHGSKYHTKITHVLSTDRKGRTLRKALSSICRDLISPVCVLRFRGKCPPSRMPSCGLILVRSPARSTHPPALLGGILSLQHTPNPQQVVRSVSAALPLTSRTSAANN